MILARDRVPVLEAEKPVKRLWRLERRRDSSLRSEGHFKNKIEFKFRTKVNYPAQAKEWLERGTRLWIYFTTPAARAMDSSLARRWGCMGSMGRR